MSELTPDEQNSLDEAWKAIRSPYQHTADEQNTLNWLAEYRRTMQENVRLVDDLRKLDEMWRDATGQSSRAIQALEAARAENARLREALAQYADRSNWGDRRDKTGRVIEDEWIGNEMNGYVVAETALAPAPAPS